MKSDSSELVDRACLLEQEMRDAAIAEASRRKEPPASFNGADCVECDGPIVAGRLALGYFTCIHCQTRIEAKRRTG